MFQELPLSGVILCYGPLLLVVGGFIAFAYYTDSLARKPYLRNLDPRSDAERPVVTPIGVVSDTATITPAGFKVILQPSGLQRIEGIGPKIDAALNRAGINTFEQLAAADVSALELILNEARISNFNQPDSWPKQAALAAKEDWDGLTKLQETLKKG